MFSCRADRHAQFRVRVHRVGFIYFFGELGYCTRLGVLGRVGRIEIQERMYGICAEARSVALEYVGKLRHLVGLPCFGVLYHTCFRALVTPLFAI